MVQEKPKAPKITQSAADKSILQYIDKYNRPLSATNVVDGLAATGVTKTVATRALDALAAEGQIFSKGKPSLLLLVK